MPPILSDVRSSIRSLARARGFTAMAIVTLGLGMALCATTLAVLDAYLLRDLSYPGADRLYWIRIGQPGHRPPRDMESLPWGSLDDVIEQPVAWDLDMFYMVGPERTEPAPGAWVTPGFMNAFGIRPAIGAGFDDMAFTPGGPNVALISHDLWIKRFGGDRGVVGRTFTAYVSDRPEEAESFTIVGVLPSSFWHFNPYTNILVPLRAPTYPYMARLRENVSPQQATGRISALVTGTSGASPVEVQLESAHDRYTNTLRPVLHAAMAAAALGLLVACANVAALLLVRATGREKDLAVRVALGASRFALIRAQATEALLLSACATLVAAVATALTLEALGAAIQIQVGRSAPGGSLALSTTTVAGIVAMGIMTALVCSLAPLAASRVMRPARGLQATGRTSTAGAANQRIRAGLIAAEVAISFTLLTGATLMLRTVVTLTATEWGMTDAGVSTTGLALRQARYPDATTRADAFARVVASLRGRPGIESVAMTTAPLQYQPGPVDAGSSTTNVGLTRTGVHRVSDGYFETLRIALLQGRALTRDDGLGAEPVAIVSTTLARRLWASGPAVGQRLVTVEEEPGGEPRQVVRTVVGVANDVRQTSADADLADVYVPLMQEPARFASVVVRTAGDGPASEAARLVREAVSGVDHEIAVSDTRQLRELRSAELTGPRFMTALISALGFISAILTLVGVYGLVAYAVRQREREIAIRVAIGAQSGRIVRLFLKQGSVVLAVGLLSGAAGVLATTRVFAAHLIGISTWDMPTLAAGALAFACVALAAMCWPAWRAAATDPATALRAE